ncbi:MAG: serine/threonine protein kinase [Acidobacteria bacterium OLB17]|nr:MAG: serine/threonine protein kinase [Acidobacteria bacterium OLB17]MCZ2392053.1 protein kinase [Acidobacteriota bacterium]
MLACPECASEVADNDIYCPYCGISLRPAELAPEPDDPYAQTIVTSASELPIPPISVTPNTAEPIASIEPAEATRPEDAARREGAQAVVTPSTDDEVRPDAGPPEASTFEPPERSIDLDATLNDYTPSAPVETLPESEVAQAATDESPEIEHSDVAAAPETPVVHDREEPQVHEAQDSAVEATPPSVQAAPVAEAPANDPAPLQAGAAPASETSSISGDSGKNSKPRLQTLSGGTVLNNRYEIISKIGGGGMGAVYLANDRNLGGVQRAVKEMVQAHIEDAQQAKAIEDFRRESMILSSLDHPSIPTIYDYFFDSSEGRFYLVMKYISGGDLAGRLRAAPEGRIDELTVAEWGFQIADVLSYLHNLPQRIVYRDLKPSNVMLDGSTGKIMLIDFGIARSVNQIEERGVTAVGTMGYAPPELFSGNVEPRSDIYSLGSTMFHLMTGADPQNNPLLIFDFEKNPRPRQINPRLSDQIEKILMRCVEYNAEKRFANAAELRDVLGQHADDLRAGRATFGVNAQQAVPVPADQTVFCGFCGQRIVAADVFCAFCGARQPLTQSAPLPAALPFPNPNRSVRTARLIVDGTSDLEAPVFMIEKHENLLGRRDPMSNIFPEVDLSKYDPQTKISRRHARIIHDGVDFLVEDLGSSNGTTILTTESGNLRLRPNQPHRLANGDRIKLGDTTLHFWVG